MTESREKKGGSRWGWLGNFVAPVGLWRMGRDTAQSIREIFKSSSETLRSISTTRQPIRSDWNATMTGLGVTMDRIQREVNRRRAMALIALSFFGVGLYGLFNWSALLPGLGCALLSALYYVQSALRLYQIRHQEFVSVVTFFSRIKRKPIELLPLGLPEGWKLYVRKSP